MKKFLPTLAALALVLSVVSCKESSTETTIEADEVYEAPVEVQTPVEVDTTVIDTVVVDSTTVQ
ncbi:MAG TPA: hypothetical protein VLN72_05640 [Gillisia sp.]|nr:hypothetical protein [Gillisia sp.]